MIEEFRDLDGLKIIIDDMLLGGVNDDEHDNRLEPLLVRVRESGLKFNRPKCEFGTNVVEYSGHLLTDADLQQLTAESRPNQSSY